MYILLNGLYIGRFILGKLKKIVILQKKLINSSIDVFGSKCGNWGMDENNCAQFMCVSKCLISSDMLIVLGGRRSVPPKWKQN